MLDLMFAIGLTGCAALLLYGAYLVLMPARKASAPNPALEDQAALQAHMLYDV